MIKQFTTCRPNARPGPALRHRGRRIKGPMEAWRSDRKKTKIVPPGLLRKAVREEIGVAALMVEPTKQCYRIVAG